MDYFELRRVRSFQRLCTYICPGKIRGSRNVVLVNVFKVEPSALVIYDCSEINPLKPSGYYMYHLD
jgi:rRNA maturation protein Rpf1